jgi:ubiquinone/menaquinone biosynthesis C-methylase UbiE
LKGDTVSWHEYRVVSIYDLVMWAYYVGHGQRSPDPARYVLAQPDWLPEGAAVLDFGGGDGRWALPLAAARNARVIVADISEGPLRRVPTHGNLRPILIDGRQLPFPDGAFELVFINHVIHHVADLPPVLRELRRVVRADGRIVCIEFHPDCTVTRIYRVFSRLRKYPCTFYLPEALAGLFGAPPFTAEHRLLNGFQYVVLARACPASASPQHRAPATGAPQTDQT